MNRRDMLRASAMLGVGLGAPRLLTADESADAGEPKSLPSNPEAQCRALVRATGNDGSKPCVWKSRGKVFAVLQDGVHPLYGFVGSETGWWKQEDEHVWVRYPSTMSFFTDLATGEFIEEFTSPFNGATVKLPPSFIRHKEGQYYTPMGVWFGSMKRVFPGHYAEKPLHLDWADDNGILRIQEGSRFPPILPQPSPGIRIAVCRDARDSGRGAGPAYRRRGGLEHLFRHSRSLGRHGHIAGPRHLAFRCGKGAVLRRPRRRLSGARPRLLAGIRTVARARRGPIVLRTHDRSAQLGLSAESAEGKAMTDVLGWRKKFGVLGPSTNTVVQPDFDDLRPPGVTNHYSRIVVQDANAISDETFMAGTMEISENTAAAVRGVLTAKPDYLVMGMSAVTFYGGVEGGTEWKRKIEDIAGLKLSVGSESVADALDAYGSRKVAFLSPYYPVANREVGRYLS